MNDGGEKQVKTVFLFHQAWELQMRLIAYFFERRVTLRNEMRPAKADLSGLRKSRWLALTTLSVVWVVK